MEPARRSIRELLKLCLDTEDPHAWAELFARLQTPVAAVIRRTLKRPQQQTVDDLVQDTWLKLLEDDRAHLRRIRSQDDNGIVAYVKCVAYTVTIDYIRRERPVASIDDPHFIEPPNEGWKEAFGQLTMEEVERCLQELSGKDNFERDHTIFWLKYRQGYTAREIAAISYFGLADKGVEAVLYKLVEYIKGRLGGDATSTSAGI